MPEYACGSFSGTGVQRTESSGDHRRRVRGRPDHAALHGSRTANLEEVDIYMHHMM